MRPLSCSHFTEHHLKHTTTLIEKGKKTEKREKKKKNHDSRGIYVFTTRSTRECFQLFYGHQRTQTNYNVNTIYLAKNI